MRRRLLGILLAGTMAVSLMAPSLIQAGELKETESEQEETAMTVSSVSVEDGVMTIELDSNTTPENDDFRWQFAGLGDESPVELLEESTEEGHTYTASLKAAEGREDGEYTIRLLHTNGFCTDQYSDFIITIEDGEIMENTSGMHVLPTSAKDLLKVLEGVWQEKTEGTAMLTISPGKEGGLDMVMSDGSGRDGKTSYYTMTAFYDAVWEALVYNNGTLHENAAITDGSEEQTESETEQGYGSGMMELILDGDGVAVTEIDWSSSEGERAEFVPASE